MVGIFLFSAGKVEQLAGGAGAGELSLEMAQSYRLEHLLCSDDILAASAENDRFALGPQ